MKPTPYLFTAAAALVLACPPLVSNSSAAGLSRATVTNIQKEVWIVPPRQSPQSATIGSVVSGSTAVRTGVKSLAEISFPDKTVLRLGSNTQFSFQEGLREVNLRTGTALFQVPKGSGGLRVRTGSITAAITGSEAKVKAPTPGEPGAFLLLNLHGTMKAVFEDSSFAGGDVPLPLPPPRGLSRLFNAAPDFSVELEEGEGFYAWVDADGEIIPDTVRKFKFDLSANIESGRLTGTGGGVTPGTQEAANRQAEQKADQTLVAVTTLKQVPGSFQALGGPSPNIRGTHGRDQARVIARIEAQEAAAAAQAAADAAAANQPTARRRVLVVRPVVVALPTETATPAAPQPTAPVFNPDLLPMCTGITPGELPFPEHGANSNCRFVDGFISGSSTAEGGVPQ